MSEFDQVLDAPELKVPKVYYAGFWLRASAYFIDVLAFMTVIVLLVKAFTQTSMSELALMPDEPPIEYILPFLSLFIIVPWLYFALMESSKLQGTLGKMAVDLKVTNMDGSRISFLQGTGRFFGKIISGMIFYIGYIMIAFTLKKQSLHDMMASTLVVKKFD